MKFRSINPIVRSIAVFGSVAAMVTGVTFAALSSSATLTNSTITSATASLLLWDGANFASTAPGFTVTGLVPGTPTAEYPVYVKNADMPLNVTVQSSTPASAVGFDDWADVKVTLVSHEPGCTDTVATNMALLIAGPVALPCNELPANSQGNSAILETAGNYGFIFNIPSAEVTGSQASVGAFNLTFTGTQSTL